MSRRSLPLNRSLLDGSLSGVLNVGGAWSRLQRSGPGQRSSCSETLPFGTSRNHSGQSVHSAVTDTSLISSLLEESSIQENTTLITTLWGLDRDGDPSEHSTSEETSGRSKRLTQRCSKLFCRDCISPPAASPPLTAASLHPEPSAIFCIGDNCKKKQHSQMLAPPSASSPRWSSSAVLGLVYSSAVQSALRCGGLCRRWNQLTSSLHLPRFSFTPSRILLPLLLLLSLGWLLASVNLSAWTQGTKGQGLSVTHSFFPSWSARDASEELQEAEELLLLEGPTEGPAQKLSDSERLLLVENSLSALWTLVDAKARQAEQLHSEVSAYASQLQPPSRREHWLRSRLDQELMQLHRRLDEEMQLREQQNHLQLQTYASRLDQLEQQLQMLAYKIQDLQSTAEPSARDSPDSLSVSLGGSSFHQALFAKVSQLEAAVGDIFRDVAHVSKGRDGCLPLAEIEQMVSELVREEVRVVVYGNQLAYRGGAVTLPEVLLPWLSQQFVSSSNLEAALLSLELSIMQNVSRQLQQFEQMAGGAATQGGGNPVNEEDVRLMLRDALQRFSEDRTGMADYALESAGGSILSTRCSETYETKAALLSMFGVPLWHFSQSPRAVIQPDVHPGNCWAFRGSTGFLVIRLSMSLLPTAFTLEHIPKTLAPSGMLLSAPRRFSVYGLQTENQEHGTLLGAFTYREDGDALQTFPVTEENKEFFQIIEVQVLSNWGHPDYTCMYRFRVHGTPS